MDLTRFRRYVRTSYFSNDETQKLLDGLDEVFEYAENYEKALQAGSWLHELDLIDFNNKALERMLRTFSCMQSIGTHGIIKLLIKKKGIEVIKGIINSIEREESSSSDEEPLQE